MMWYWGSGAHWWAWLLGAIGMVAFWGLLVWGIWFFVVSATRRPDHDHASGGARRILDERLARGEIDPEEYRRLRDLITDGDRVPVTTGDRR